MKKQFRVSQRFAICLCLIGLGVGTGLALLSPAHPKTPDIVVAPPAAPTSVLHPGATVTQPVRLESKLSSYNPIVDEDVPVHVHSKSIFPETPAFSANGSEFVAVTEQYQAKVSLSGELHYQPLGGGNASLDLALKAVTHGDTLLFDSSSGAPGSAGVANGDVVLERLTGLSERFSARGDGVEQRFTVKQLPAAIGDLVFNCEFSAPGLTAQPARVGRTGGISFLDEKGRVAVRYGQLVVRDARMESVVIEPHLDSSGFEIAFSIPERWLSTAEFPIVIAPRVVTDLSLSPSGALGVSPPTIVAGNNNYLVAWNDYRGGTNFPQIFASIVTPTGIATANFALSPATGFPLDYASQRVEAAFDGTNFLVVWSDNRATGPGIRGVLLGPNATIVGGTDFLIAPTSGQVVEAPLVAFNGAEYVVAFQDLPNGANTGSQIFYSQVTTSGQVKPAVAVPANFSPANEVLEFLTAQKPGGDTLLLYRESAENPAQTRSIRVATDGTIHDPGGTSLFKQNLTDGGFGLPIGVAFVESQWHVLSSTGKPDDSSVFLHKVDAFGSVTPPSGVFAEIGAGNVAQLEDSFPTAVAGTGEWLFLRNDRLSATQTHLIGKRVTYQGIDRDPIPFQIDTRSHGAIRGSVGAHAGNSFLVAWMDGRGGVQQLGDPQRIFAALLDDTTSGTSHPQLVASASASPSRGEAPLIVMFDSGTSTGAYDTIFWDFGDGTTEPDAPQISHTYKNSGVYSAHLILTKGGYSVVDEIVITVGASSAGRARVEDPEQQIIGEPRK